MEDPFRSLDSPPGPARSGVRRWGPVLLLVAVGIPLSLLLTFSLGNPVGIELWVLVLVLVALWNFRTAWHAWKRFRAVPRTDGTRKRRELLLFLGSLGCAVFWGPLYPLLYTPFAAFELLGALFAGIWAMVRLRRATPAGSARSRLAIFLPVYDLFALLTALAWTFANYALFPEGVPSLLFYGLVRGNALFQELGVSLLAGFLVVFVLPPVLPEPLEPAAVPAVTGPTGPVVAEPSASGARVPPPARLRPRPRLLTTAVRTLRVAVAVTVVLTSAYMVVLTPLGYDEVGGFDALPGVGGSSYALEPGFRFGIVAASLTDTLAPPPDFPRVLAEEISLARSLGVNYVRFDIQEELLHSPQGPADLRMAVDELRNASFGVILSPFGYESWGSNHPSLTVLNATIYNESLYLAGFHPDYLFPFYEPNGQVQVNLGHALPTAQWLGMISATAAAVRAASPSTQVLIEIADGPQGLSLAQGLLSDPNVNAIGFDLYPGSVSDLSKVDAYANVVRSDPSKAFWISEMGMETATFGTEAQAHFIATMVSRATERWNASGLCVWGLEDNVGLGLSYLHLDSLGLVTQADQPKAGFYAYQAAIHRVHQGT